jgi:hypothetical protein
MNDAPNAKKREKQRKKGLDLTPRLQIGLAAGKPLQRLLATIRGLIRGMMFRIWEPK